MTEEDVKRGLRISEAGALLGVARQTIRRRIEEGDMLVNDAGLVSMSEIRRFLTNHLVPQGGSVTAAIPRLLSLAQVAEQTGLSRRALEDGARALPPKFEHVRHGGRRWMTEQQVVKLINAVTVTPDMDELTADEQGKLKDLQRFLSVQRSRSR